MLLVKFTWIDYVNTIAKWPTTLTNIPPYLQFFVLASFLRLFISHAAVCLPQGIDPRILGVEPGDDGEYDDDNDDDDDEYLDGGDDDDDANWDDVDDEIEPEDNESEHD